jgi:hypothetical protein
MAKNDDNRVALLLFGVVVIVAVVGLVFMFTGASTQTVVSESGDDAALTGEAFKISQARTQVARTAKTTQVRVQNQVQTQISPDIVNYFVNKGYAASAIVPAEFSEQGRLITGGVYNGLMFGEPGDFLGINEDDFRNQVYNCPPSPPLTCTEETNDDGGCRTGCTKSLGICWCKDTEISNMNDYNVYVEGLEEFMELNEGLLTTQDMIELLQMEVATLAGLDFS